MANRHPDAALSRWSREHWLLAGMFGFLGSSLVAIVPGFANAIHEPVQTDAVQATMALPLPRLAQSARSAVAVGWQIVRVQSGQTLGDVFTQMNLPLSLMHRLMEQPSMKEALSRLRAGEEIAFALDERGQLQGLRFDSDESHRVELALKGDQVSEKTIDRSLEHRVEVATGTISSSLYADGAHAGLSSATINEMANVFKYDIDFAQDLRDGDNFQVVYEEVWRDGERLRDGGILGASFINQGKRYTAYRYDHDGKAEYFDENGRPLRKTLLRIPIEFARLSSTFGMRNHPVLGRMRMHKGVDYAAPTGTPIMAAGDGRVSFVGWKNGYGRAVVIEHGQGRSTLYGHMSAWGKEKVGQSVSQGATIGYVGMSGLATGPHLHYEFRINGNQVNPLSVTMPKPEPLAGAELARFRAATAPALAKLQLIEGSRLASR